jgi:hypothetical protein
LIGVKTSTNLESRNPKQVQMTKIPKFQTNALMIGGFELFPILGGFGCTFVLGFDIRIWDLTEYGLFRITCFEFRIWTTRRQQPLVLLLLDGSASIQLNIGGLLERNCRLVDPGRALCIYQVNPD